MKQFISILVLATALLTAACKKGPYTCYCSADDPAAPSQNYGLTTDDRDDANYQCDEFQTRMNQGNTTATYSCRISR